MLKKFKKSMLWAFLCIGIMATNAWSRSSIVSTANEASHILKASGGTLYSLVCYNAGATQFIQVFNSATVPANGTVPVVTPMTCPASLNCSYDLGSVNGQAFSTGIVWTNSSTEQTKTIGAADVWCTGVIQ